MKYYSMIFLPSNLQLDVLLYTKNHLKSLDNA